jgi:hypothetical protein
MKEKGVVRKQDRMIILPTIAISYIVPSIAMFVVPGLTNRQWVNGVFFQLFPLWAFIVQQFLRVLGRDSEPEEVQLEQGLSSVRFLYEISGMISGSVYLCLWILSPFPIMDIFFLNLRNPETEIGMLKGAAKVLRYDQISAFGAGAVWIGLHFWDLKRKNLVSGGWGKLLALLIGMTLVAGPGAGMAVMWSWREGALWGREKG